MSASKVNVLGTEYKIRKVTEEEYPKLKTMDANGLAELYSKELIINSQMDDSGKAFAKFDEFEKKVVRHEIVHAFFHESGLNDYCNDENLVDWMAMQVLKIIKAFQDAKCI